MAYKDLPRLYFVLCNLSDIYVIYVICLYLRCPWISFVLGVSVRLCNHASFVEVFVQICGLTSLFRRHYSWNATNTVEKVILVKPLLETSFIPKAWTVHLQSSVNCWRTHPWFKKNIVCCFCFYFFPFL